MSLSKHEESMVKNQLNTVWNATLSSIALTTKFIQRSSNRISAIDFVYLLSIDLVSNPLASLAECCRRLFEWNPKTKLTPQALSERINSNPCVAFFKAVFSTVLGHNRDKIVASVPSSLLASFKRVLVEDSTQIQLHPKLSEAFAGSGGSASASSVKLDLIEDIKNNHMEYDTNST